MCVGVTVGVGVIAWVWKGVYGWDSLDCCLKVCTCVCRGRGEEGECVCVCVCVSAWVRRVRGSLDGWCMFVWCGQGLIITISLEFPRWNERAM